MSRYIDADALKIPSEEIIAKMIIDSAPSIDIVRCKECKWGKWCRSNGEFYLWCRPNIKRVKENGFCDCGERREP